MSEMLDRLHSMLSKVLSDDEIVAGVQLSMSGMTKVCNKLGIDHKEAELLIASLRTSLNEASDRLSEMKRSLSEDDERYTYEEDFLGGVTLRDAVTGKSIALIGSRAADLVSKLETGDTQTVIAAYFPGIMENDSDHYAAKRETGFYGRAGAGCIVLARATNRILIAHRSDYEPPHDVDQPGTWGTWGGAIDQGEDPKQAVVRELGEEAMYHGSIEDIVPLFVFKKPGFAYHNFLVVVPDEFTPHLNWESQGFRWVEFGKWPSPLHPGLKSLLSDRASLAAIQNIISENPLTEDDETINDEQSFDSEIASSDGTFNFMWNINGQHGFGTARFTGRGPGMKISVMRAADAAGKPVDMATMSKALNDQAREFIGSE